MPSNARDKITYPFPNFNGETVEVSEWISNFIPNFTRQYGLFIHVGIDVKPCQQNGPRCCGSFFAME